MMKSTKKNRKQNKDLQKLKPLFCKTLEVSQYVVEDQKKIATPTVSTVITG